ncbi:bifunctional alpha,alpha-trehalose-phosphate synthase (UDP-forming)/trehalose-phosphatase [Fulvivirgaceae bacterium BMA10]|uniref:Bifunctional alpha,alpha-trehalose-phosphate synthase (UDP-forming)/trehalose-phosphatase n=1 Tax=Splendidivirga corallicola TaxID=3051826 RepID=A0ABT8KN18_9BACT|nr:bifunctional alpha,alpha-trehalose-phosphate synthase (UDP-forming)/trehalose-phosphatase [Fulvivirgaceae bacterium BMA10]
MSKIIIIANRLPVSITINKGEVELKPSAGGLATGLKSLHTDKEIVWLGWPGISTEDPELQNEITKKLGEMKMHPVFIPAEQFEKYYDGFSNETLWPLFHYFQQYTIYQTTYWMAYKEVNHIFMEALVNIADKHDIFWVHDYHLMLVPNLIRKKFRKASIGFFLHIPFPSYELFRTLPWRDELLQGIIGANLIGFHTYDYVRHFMSAVSRILHLDHHFLGRISLNDRIVEVDSFPMGIDYNKYANAVEEEETKIEIERYKRTVGNEKIILAIDRLDYSKALPKRLKAFDRFLELNPDYKGKISMVVILVPSRASVKQYQDLKDEIDLSVGKINGKYGTSTWTPIHYYYRAFRFSRLIAWYHIAPIALVTPFRDGMNLVSKEYIATKKDGKGVLILSEMAGSAKELTTALQVNPNSTADIVRAMHEALNMPEEEQVRRNRFMQSIIKRNNIDNWAKNFLERMEVVQKESELLYNKHFNSKIESQLLKDFVDSQRRLIFLDYDGTLVNFVPNPEDAKPTDELINMLNVLAKDDKNKLVIISGRDKDTLGEWFKDLNIDMIAEHGVWHKPCKEDWAMMANFNDGWKPEIKDFLQQFVDRTPGSFIEEKSYSIAWHYRKTDPGLAEIRKNELTDKLGILISGSNLQMQDGNKVIEVKSSFMNKGKAATHWLKDGDWPFILAIGDDYTDEDTFRALPKEAYTLKVGLTSTAARFNIDSVEDVRALLDKLVVN